MSAEPSPAGGVLAEYRARLAARSGVPSVRDELLDAAPVRDTGLLEAIERWGPEGLFARRATTRRLVQDDAITWGGDAGSRRLRPWDLDPVPVVIDGPAFERLSEGLRQRARLWDALLADLRGPQRMLRGTLPPEVILAHPRWTPLVEGARSSMVVSAVDLTRDADGGWQVLDDLTQAPIGAGFAMANRRIIARVLADIHRRVDLQRLRVFFDWVTEALLAAADLHQPRVVLLSSGAAGLDSYDQALQSTLLGFPLVEADDLTVRDGSLWLRTTGRLEPVDVVMRRVAALDADPLELRAGSRVGVPGLIEAERAGRVAVANPVAAGVLENPGLAAYAAPLAERLLGEELLLGSPPTWWCGSPASRQHVLSRLAGLVVRPIGELPGVPRPIVGERLTTDERNRLRRRIQAEPELWCGQEPSPVSTAPVVGLHRLDVASVVVRTFTVARPQGHAVMPGGLALAGLDPAEPVPVLGRCATKDVWVLADAAHPAAPRIDVDRLLAARIAAVTPRLAPSPRAAEALFRLGRRAETAESTARLLRQADNLAEDHLGRIGTPGYAAALAMWSAVAKVTGVGVEVAGRDGWSEPVSAGLHRLILDPATPGSVASQIAAATTSAAAVRDQLSLDTWSLLGRLERTLQTSGNDFSAQQTLSAVIESLLALAGISAESLVRDLTWAFADAGRRLERARLTLTIVSATLATPRPPVIEGLVTESVLLVADSILWYRRRMAAGVGPVTPIAGAIDLLLLDDTNPRSVAYQLDRLAEALALAPDVAVITKVRELSRRLREADLDELCAGDRAELMGLLMTLTTGLEVVERRLKQAYFVHQARSRAFTVSELAGPGGDVATLGTGVVSDPTTPESGWPSVTEWP